MTDPDDSDDVDEADEDTSEEGEEPFSGVPGNEVIECPMCHQLVRVSQTIRTGGRVLCLGCAGGWYDDDEAESEDEE